MVNVAPVPERLENPVGIAKHQQVLHRFLPQIVVDAEYLLFPENLRHNLVQFPGAGKIASKRLFDDNLRPGLLAKLRIGQTRRPKVLHDHRKKTGRRGKVEEPIAGSAAFPIKTIEQRFESVVSRWIIEVIGNVVDALAEALQKWVTLAGELQILFNRLPHFLPKAIVGGGRPSAPDDGESGRQHALAR